MGRLNFKDIGDWTPSSISVVDQPDHPLAVFEVYEDDEEFVKKSINVEDIMVDVNNVQEENVSIPSRLFEKLLGGTVLKSSDGSTEPPAKPPEKNEGTSDTDKIMQKLDAMDKKIDGIDERVTKIEKEEEPGEGEDGNTSGDGDPVPGTVTKNEGNTEGQTTSTPGDGNVVDDNHVVTKSREVDPDLELVVTKSEKTLYERMGRNANGMTW